MQAVQRSVTRQNKKAPITFNKGVNTGHACFFSFLFILMDSHFDFPAHGEKKVMTNIMHQLISMLN